LLGKSSEFDLCRLGCQLACEPGRKHSANGEDEVEEVAGLPLAPDRHGEGLPADLPALPDAAGLEYTNPLRPR